MYLRLLIFFLFICCFNVVAKSVERITIATASSFNLPLISIKENFEKKHDIIIDIISGASGKLTTSLIHGAPYQLFFSADTKFSEILEKRGRIRKENSLTYAKGKLYLLMKNGSCENLKKKLKSPNVRISIANPQIAPFGRAAKEYLKKIKIWEDVKDSLLTGENVSQSYQWFYTDNVDFAFVSNSFIPKIKKNSKTVTCEIDNKNYSNMEQELVVINNTENIKKFIDYFQTDKHVQDVIKKFGYEVN